MAVLMLPVTVWSQEVERTKADTNREVAITYAQVYLEQQLFYEAESVLQFSLKNDGQSGGVLNLLGLIQLKQNHLEQACYSFQTAAIVFTDLQDRIYALYNLADCFHRGTRRDDATRVLKELSVKEVGISNSAERALDLIQAGELKVGDALPPYAKNAQQRFRVSGMLTSGFDSNVLLIEENVSRGTPLNERGSFYVAPALQLGYVGPIFNRTVDSRWVSAFTNYFNSEVNTFNNFYNRLDFYFGSGAHRWNVFGDLVFLNNSGFTVYNYDGGLSWQWKRKYGANDVLMIETPLRYQKFVLTNGVSEDNDRTGADLQLRANYRSLMSDTDFWSLAGTLDTQYSTGKNYRLLGLTLPANLGVSLPWVKDLGLVNTFMAELGGQYYWQSDLGRRDWWYKAGAGLLAPFFKDWSITLDYYYFKNNSTVAAATYSKGVVSLLLSKDLL